MALSSQSLAQGRATQGLGQLYKSTFPLCPTLSSALGLVASLPFDVFLA